MTPKRKISIILANPRGFCAGVERAIDIVEKSLIQYGAPIYVKHEIVHNKYVIESLKAKGAIFTDDISSIPEGSIVIFSAHGVSKQVELDSKERNLHILDATCPLVKKVHNEIQNHVSVGKKVVLVGHQGHPEVEGTMGRVNEGEVHLIQNISDVEKLHFDKDEKIAYVTQTTLSIDDTQDIANKLSDKYQNIEGRALQDICYATQNRQDAVKNLSKVVDIIFVIGSRNSSNSNRLKDVGDAFNIPSYLIDDERDIDIKWMDGKNKVGITAGASAPQILLDKVLEFFSSHYETIIDEIDGVIENVKFKIPKELNNQ